MAVSILRPRLQVVYVALAALVLVTVGTSVYLGVRLLNIYTDSVRTNATSEGRSARYRDLAALAGTADAPGNELFESKDLRREQARLDTAVARYRVGMTAAREELGRNTFRVCATIADIAASTRVRSAVSFVYASVSGRTFRPSSSRAAVMPTR